MASKKYISLEDKIHSLFSPGSSFTYENLTHIILQSEKPTISAKGECKTDLFVKTQTNEDKIKHFRISIKKDDKWFIENKLTLERAKQILGKSAQERIIKHLLKIEDLFLGQKLIYYYRGNKNIRIGWRFDIGEGKSGHLSEKMDLSDDEKIEIYSGANLSSDKKNAFVGGEIIKDSGIADYILIVDTSEYTLQEYVNRMELISDYAPKIDCYFACKGINFRVNHDKWDSDRPLSVWLDWKVVSGELKVDFVFDDPCVKTCNEVGENIRSILSNLGVAADNFEDLKGHFDKFNKPFFPN